MSVLSGKNVLLGITGGIAAYKSAFLVRLLKKKGGHVRVVMTPASRDFVTPLTLSTLSGNEVHSSFTHEQDENAVWNNHVELALWADLMVIAPATATTLAKMATGNSDNLLLGVYRSAKCPVYFVPAMDLDMYKHPSTKNTFKILGEFGNIMIPATHGELASGLVGEGRMAEPADIVAFVEQNQLKTLPLHGKKILITAGPTYEAIDPVRFIGNHSSGKMGVALALEAASLGAQVTLVLGPSAIRVEKNTIEVVSVTTAAEMYEKVMEHYESSAVVIMAAAVSDYRPKHVADIKIKKKQASLNIELEPTIDILATLGNTKKDQFLVGFALETDNVVEYAKGKLSEKNLDMIVVNSLQDKGAGFGTDTNKISILEKGGTTTHFELKPKKEVAVDVFRTILDHIHA